MRIKLLLASLVLIFSFILVAGQITHVSAVDGDNPITGPITGPITSPESPTPTPTSTPTATPTSTPTSTPTVTPSPSITPTPTATPPVTAPAGRIISGHISFRIIGFAHNLATNAMVEASNIFTNNKVSGATDLNGNYSLSVKPGLYLVGPKGGSLFVPYLRVVDVSKNNANNVNFQDLIISF